MKNKDFGAFIRKLREDRRLSLRQVERSAGVSYAYLSQVEKGVRNVPSINFLEKIAKTYGVTVNFLTQTLSCIEKDTSLPVGLEDQYILEKYKKLSNAGKENFKSYLQYLVTMDENSRNIEQENYLETPTSSLALDILNKLQKNEIYFEGYNLQEKEVLNYLGYKLDQMFPCFDEKLEDKIDIEHLNKNGGVIFKNEKKVWISMDVRPDYRRLHAFRLIAHVLLPEHENLYYISSFKDKFYVNVCDKASKEALELALELIFPKNIFIEDVNKAPITVEAIERLAEKYKVPVDITALRFAKLNSNDIAIAIVDKNGKVL